MTSLIDGNLSTKEISLVNLPAPKHIFVDTVRGVLLCYDDLGRYADYLIDYAKDNEIRADRVTAEVGKLEEAVNENASVVATLSADVANASSDLAARDATIERLNDTISDYEDACRQKQEIINSEASLRDDANATIGTLTEALGYCKSDIERLKMGAVLRTSELASSQASNARLQEKVDQLKEDAVTLDATYNTLAEEREQLLSRVATLQGDVTDLEDCAHSDAETISRHVDDYKKLEQTNARLHSEVENYGADFCDELQQTIDERNVEITGLQGDVRRITQVNISNVQNRDLAIEARDEKIVALRDEMQNAADVANVELKKYRNEAAAAEDAANSNAEMIAGMSSEITELHELCAARRADIRRQSEVISDYEDACRQKQEIIDSEASLTDDAHEKLKTARDDLQDVRRLHYLEKGISETLSEDLGRANIKIEEFEQDQLFGRDADSSAPVDVDKGSPKKSNYWAGPVPDFSFKPDALTRSEEEPVDPGNDIFLEKAASLELAKKRRSFIERYMIARHSDADPYNKGNIERASRLWDDLQKFFAEQSGGAS